MRLVGRGWYQSLSGAYEEPPAMPVGQTVDKVYKRVIHKKMALLVSAVALHIKAML